jgi:hypothetical protein
MTKLLNNRFSSEMQSRTATLSPREMVTSEFDRNNIATPKQSSIGRAEKESQLGA